MNTPIPVSQVGCQMKENQPQFRLTIRERNMQLQMPRLRYEISFSTAKQNGHSDQGEANCDHDRASEEPVDTSIPRPFLTDQKK